MVTFYLSPFFSPVLCSFGPIKIHWYGVAYVVSFLLAFFYASHLVRKSHFSCLTKEHLDSLVSWIIGGVLIGGRLGHAFFYEPEFYLSNPLEILMIWKGGMSFHGGLLGVFCVILLYSYKIKTRWKQLADLIATVAPIGLFFGRLANFINQELYGQPTTFFLSVVFPFVDNLPRHPTQLYEAFGEGVGLGLLLFYLWKKKYYYSEGAITGVFLFLYGFIRFFIEYLKEPDYLLNLSFFLTRGQLFCLLMGILGLGFIAYSSKKRAKKIDY